MTAREELVEQLQAQAVRIRRHILTMTYAAQSGHPGGSLSATDIVTALYFHFMKIDPKDPSWASRDRFILSKGHACPVWYSCLAERGFFPVEELETLRQINSRLQGHPDMKSTPGVDSTTGSLGQGLSIGIGMALGLRTTPEHPRVYVMLGDGELNEGQIWEAAMAGAKYGLDNLTAIIDYNDLQLDGYCHDIMPLEPLRDKWVAFNWNVLEIDGHQMSAIVEALEVAQTTTGKPTVIIARTVKGKGVSFMEDACDWHGQTQTDSDYTQAMGELGVALDDAHLTAIKSRRASQLPQERWQPTPRRDAPDTPTRDAYGEALAELGADMPELVVLEADISKSTRTNRFAEKFPERFYQFGVAEANMMAAAAGFATTGKIPFVSTYAVFASMRACEQLRTSIAYPRHNVKVAVSHGGLNPGSDGATHQATEDLGMMRTIPGLTVIMPADYHATKALVRAAASYPGPVYLRFTRDPVPQIYGPDQVFEIGKGIILRRGNDVTIVALGDMVSVGLDAADELSAAGISPEVIDLHTLKPIDRELIIESATRTGRVVTVEDHQIQCGLGGAVAELLSETAPVPIRRIGLRDTFGESGPFDLLLQKNGMDVSSVVAAAKELVFG